MTLDARGAARIDAGGMNPKTVKVSLELHVADDSLSGSACNGTGAERPFSGWLGLIRTIDPLVDEHGTPSHRH